jgi:predicted nucleotidyltransferase
MEGRCAQLKHIFQSNGVALAYLFGSMAAASHRFLTDGQLDTSDRLADVDLGVVFGAREILTDPALRGKRYSDLFNDLTEVFPEDRLDLVLLQETHSVFQAQAMMGFCIYAISPVFKAAYEERILARAADFRPFLERYYEERFGGVTP